MTAETTWQHTWPWPVWIAALAGAALAAFAVWIYLREPRHASPTWRVILPLLRMLALLLVLWMMLGWTFQRHRTEPAELILAIDDSASMAFVHDDWDAASAAKLKRLHGPSSESVPSRFDVARWLLAHPRFGWIEPLRKEYNLRTVWLADSVREFSVDASSDLDDARPDRSASRLGEGVRALLDSQRGRPTAAIVLLTDGATTEGPSVADVGDFARQFGVPLFCVGMGSDTPVRDLRLSDLLADDVAFVDDTVTLSAQLHVTGFTGQRTLLKLTRTDTKETLVEQTIALPPGVPRVPLRLSFRARTTGEYPLRVTVDPLDRESDADNNQLSHRLHVHDSTIRVLLVQSSPSYEYRKLRDLLARATKPTGDGTQKAFALATLLQEADPEWVTQESGALGGFPWSRDELFAYDVVILGDANPAYLGTSGLANLADFVEQHGGGLILVAGPRFMPLAYRGTPLQRLFPFDLATVTAPGDSLLDKTYPVRLTPIGQWMPPCQLLPSPEENARLWSQLPGLYWSVDVPDPSPAARVLLEHPERHHAAGGALPLVLLQYAGTGKVVFQGIDETYRWARHEGTEDYYARYWLQMVRYAGRSKLLRDGSSAELILDRQHFAYGEPVPIQVRFRQAGLAPRAPATVEVVVQPEVGTAPPLVLQRAGEDPPAFAGAASGLAPGTYRAWLSAPSLPTPPASKSFDVASPTREQAMTPLNSQDLEAAAKISRGRYYPLRTADALLGDLPRGERLRIESLPAQPIWNSPLVAALVIALLTTEWVLRRRIGLL